MDKHWRESDLFRFIDAYGLTCGFYGPHRGQSLQARGLLYARLDELWPSVAPASAPSLATEGMEPEKTPPGPGEGLLERYCGALADDPDLEAVVMGMAPGEGDSWTGPLGDQQFLSGFRPGGTRAIGWNPVTGWVWPETPEKS